MSYKILVINPGSTSTKLAFFEDEDKLYETNIFHDAPELAKFGSVNNQLEFRKQMILEFMAENGIELKGIDAIVGRGGDTVSINGGVYEVNDKLIADNLSAVNGVRHPANLGVPLAAELASECGARAFMVDGPKVDEFNDEARITGLKGYYRASSLHALNLKGTARFHCRKHGLNYEDSNLIVCHIDGGISISAHMKGRMVDGSSNSWGEGPFTPTRIGALPVRVVERYINDTEHDDNKIAGDAEGIDKTGIADTSNEHKISIDDALIRAGGFVSHFGTSNSDTVHSMVEDGDPEATRVWNAMLYNICKMIGEMATVLNGKVNGIVLGGGLLRFYDLRGYIEARCGWIAPVYFYPGEVEHEAMANGALRVLRGEEEAQIYTGIPVWNGFDD